MTNTASSLPQVEELHGLPPSAAATMELTVLRQAIGQALDRKRRLGQYAVVWQGGEVRQLPPEALPAWPAGASVSGAAYGARLGVQVVAAWEPMAQGLNAAEEAALKPRDPP